MRVGHGLEIDRLTREQVIQVNLADVVKLIFLRMHRLSGRKHD